MRCVADSKSGVRDYCDIPSHEVLLSDFLTVGNHITTFHVGGAKAAARESLLSVHEKLRPEQGYSLIRRVPQLLKVHSATVIEPKVLRYPLWQKCMTGMGQCSMHCWRAIRCCPHQTFSYTHALLEDFSLQHADILAGSRILGIPTLAMRLQQHDLLPARSPNIDVFPVLHQPATVVPSSRTGGAGGSEQRNDRR